MKNNTPGIRILPALLATVLLLGMYPAIPRDESPLTERTTATAAAEGPYARADAAGAYSAEKDAYFIFGGADGDTLYRDMWRFWKGGWRKEKPRKTSLVPPARSRHCMEYDSFASSLLLFGGKGKNGALGDFWVYKNRRWKRLPDGPSPREGAAVAMHSTYKYNHLYLFGGRNGAKCYNDFWRWDGSAWALWDGSRWRFDHADVKGSAPGNPSARAYHMMMCFANEIIISGGENVHGFVYKGDLYDFFIGLPDSPLYGWEPGWRKPWQVTTISKQGSGRKEEIRLMKSPVAGNLRFGGFTGEEVSRLFLELDIDVVYIDGPKPQRSLVWKQVKIPANAPRPAQRAGHVFIFNYRTTTSLLFGGWRNGKVMNDTWIYDYNDVSWKQIN